MKHMTAIATTLLLASVAPAQFLNRPGSGGSGSAAGATGGTPAGSPSGSPLGGGIGSAPSAGGFSPYLNLARGSNAAAINYYGIVRPQQNFQTSLQSLQTQQQGPAVTEPDDPLMPGIVVGTRSRFLNTGGYFLNLSGGTTASGTSGGMRGTSGVGAQSTLGQSTLGGSGMGAGFFSTGLGAAGALLGSSPNNRGGGSRGPSR